MMLKIVKKNFAPLCPIYQHKLDRIPLNPGMRDRDELWLRLVSQYQISQDTRGTSDANVGRLALDTKQSTPR
jgi:hypothetical protein